MYTYKGLIEITCNWCQSEKIYSTNDKSLSDEKFIDMVEEMAEQDIISYCDECDDKTNWSVSDYEMPKLEIIE